MRLSTISTGDEVFVSRGYARRPAVVLGVRATTVVVRFTDVTPAQAAAVPTHARGGMLGATVRPNAITARSTP